MTLSEELAVAEDIAREAGRTLVSYFRSGRERTRAKGDRDVVTEADFAAEEIVRRRLQASFPNDAIRGEEGTNLGEATREWFIDPLDGTLNYSRGLPIWCVSLSLFERGRPLLGIIFDPLNSELFTAARGHGVFLNDVPIQTSGLSVLEDAFVHVTVDFRDDSMLEGLEDIGVIAPRVLRVRNTGSASLALAYVACGRFDAMLHRYAHPWDYGAGVLLIEEAGGCVRAADGGEYTSSTVSVVATATETLCRDLLVLTGPGGQS